MLFTQSKEHTFYNNGHCVGSVFRMYRALSEIALKIDKGIGTRPLVQQTDPQQRFLRLVKQFQGIGKWENGTLKRFQAVTPELSITKSRPVIKVS